MDTYWETNKTPKIEENRLVTVPKTSIAKRKLSKKKKKNRKK